MWEGIIPQFENEYSIVVPDIRGHGRSDKPLTGYHIDDMANDLYLLLLKLNIESCHIVGSSMGAEVGLSLAAAHPELVRSLICEGALCNEFGEFGLFNGTEDEIKLQKEILQKELTKRQEPVYQTKQEYIKEIQAELEPQGLWNEYFLSYFKNNLQQTNDGEFTYCYLNYIRNEYIQKYWDVRFEQYYKRVKCPILFLLSEEEREDERISHSLSAFTQLLTKYEIKHIENSIHAYVWMQLPQKAGEFVKSFIMKYDLDD